MRALTGFLLENRLVVFVLTGLGILAGLGTAPFRWDLGPVPRDPVQIGRAHV